MSNSFRYESALELYTRVEYRREFAGGFVFLIPGVSCVGFDAREVMDVCVKTLTIRCVPASASVGKSVTEIR